MKQIEGQQGYALLIVLLMVVLFLGLSATFMAGSLSNSKQEQTIDASNQSVASAEMGVRFYSTDFEREISIIKKGILAKTQVRIQNIIDCFNSGDKSCDQQHELTAFEKKIDKDMRAEYILLVEQKVAELKALKDIQNTPFPEEDVHFAITGASIKKLNAEGKDATLSETVDKEIKALQVQLHLSGEFKGITKQLKGFFTVKIPSTFLSDDKRLILGTKTEGAKAGDVFKETQPSKWCVDLIDDISKGKTPIATDCTMKAANTVEGFINSLKSYNLDPKNFSVYVQDFQKSYCRAEGTSGEGCNQKVFDGLTVNVSDKDPVLVNKVPIKWNGLSSSNTVINGLFTIASLNNTNTYASPPGSQTITVRELQVTGDISGGGLRYTNLVVLGKKSESRLADSRMKYDGKVMIGEYGKVCFDLDRIIDVDWKGFRDKVQFSDGNKTGRIIYYSKDAEANPFILPADSGGSARLTSAEKTALYVRGYDNYTTFVNSCGGNLAADQITEVPFPHIVDLNIEVDVKY